MKKDITMANYRLYERYSWIGNPTSLEECYGRYSVAKARADQWCRNRMVDMDGWGYRIFSHNTFGFSCGWEHSDENYLYCHIETPNKSLDFKVGEFTADGDILFYMP